MRDLPLASSNHREQTCWPLEPRGGYDITSARRKVSQNCEERSRGGKEDRRGDRKSDHLTYRYAPPGPYMRRRVGMTLASSPLQDESWDYSRPEKAGVATEGNLSGARRGK